jgi:hypothetical protein
LSQFLPQTFAATLVEAVSALPDITGHYRYSPAQLHVTLRNLDGADLERLPALLAHQHQIRLQAASRSVRPLSCIYADFLCEGIAKI